MYVRGEEDKVFKIVDTPEKVLSAITGFEREFKERLKKFMGVKGERAFMAGGIGYRGPEFKVK